MGRHRKVKFSMHFKERLVAGMVGTIALSVCIYYSLTPFFKPIFILLNALVVSVALLEYYRLAEAKGFQPLTRISIGSSAFYIIALGFGASSDNILQLLPSLILWISFLLFFLVFLNNHPAPIGNLAITTFGILYLTIPISCAIRINYCLPEQACEAGRMWLAYTLIISKITDTGAYFCGKVFGKNKLAPSISPHKTIEGAIGGMAAALMTSLLFFQITHLTHLFTATFAQSIGMGLLISFLAQLGDLAESLLKRDAGVKDSSDLPGLGGILDIVDSLVFSLPLMYLLLEMHIVG